MNANDIQGFHIELTNMCTLKCPGCARTKFIDKWPQHWNNHNLDTSALFRFLDLDLSKKKFLLCGVYGDPIYHPDFLDVVAQIKKRGASVSIITNGSYKSKIWWQNLIDVLDSNDKITFSVDGIPENFTQYRINADWKTIQDGMDIVASASCNSEWKYLVFAYNENNIQTAQKLCNKIGIKSFELEYSDRFDESTQNLIPVNENSIGQRHHFRKIANTQFVEVEPRCVKTQQHHFITADGFYSPCCYIADHRFYYKTDFGKNKKKYNIKECTLTEVLKKPEVVDFYDNLQNHPACQFNCPRI